MIDLWAIIKNVSSHLKCPNEHKACYTPEILNDYIVMLCDWTLHMLCRTTEHVVAITNFNLCCMEHEKWSYVLGMKHLSCRNVICVIVREGQFLNLKQCRKELVCNRKCMNFRRHHLMWNADRRQPVNRNCMLSFRQYGLMRSPCRFKLTIIGCEMQKNIVSMD